MRKCCSFISVKIIRHDLFALLWEGEGAKAGGGGGVMRLSDFCLSPATSVHFCNEKKKMRPRRAMRER